VYFLYSMLMGLAAFLLLPYWIFHGLRHGKYFTNLRQRLGFSFPALDKLAPHRQGAIWIHAVSVGEALSGITLARRLKEKFPNRPLIVSTTTITGQQLVRERMPFADALLYFPLDWVWCVRRALAAVQPSIIVVLETEIWPNFLREARRRNVPVVFASGRISDHSFERYQRYFTRAGFFLKPFLKSALGHASAFLMQSDKDAERIAFLGASPERVSVGGNLKYDMELPAPTPIAQWLEIEARRHGRSPIIVAGSVVAAEEPLALIAFGVLQGEFPRALLVLAPRKPERFEAAAEFIEESHRKFIRRSQLPVPGAQDSQASFAVQRAAGNGSLAGDVSVILLDSIGELGSVYRIGDGAFVGGSLVASGGHNILEPAAFGKVPVFGPSMENFADVASRFVSAGAAIQVENPEDAGVAWIELLRDPQRQQRMSANARRLVDSSRGATDRVLIEVGKYLNTSDRGNT
jgi:3-deoxy-D-manno-octulosonic-acid transferase